MTWFLLGFAFGVMSAGMVAASIGLFDRQEKPRQTKRRRGVCTTEFTSRHLLLGSSEGTLTLTVEEVERAGNMVRVEIVGVAGHSRVSLADVRRVAPEWMLDEQIHWLDPASPASS
jgi:hypothetical protein